MLNANDVSRIMREITEVYSTEHDKVVCHCPVAQWEHSGGFDNNPSFAVMKGQTGWWVNCLACRYRKTLEGLIWDLMKRTKKPLTKIMACLYSQKEDPINSAPINSIRYNPLGEYSAKNKPSFKRSEYSSTAGIQTDLFRKGDPQDLPINRPSTFDLHKWESLEPPMDYVKQRGISYEAYKEWRLGHNPIHRRLMFPVFDREHTYVGYTGRLYENGDYCFGCGHFLIMDKAHGVTGEIRQKKLAICPKCRKSHIKYKHFKGKWRRNVIYGLHREAKGPIVITEGTMDAIRLWMLGVSRPVCIFGTNLSPNQIKELKETYDPTLEYPIIFMGDNDDAGREMAIEGVKILEKHDIPSFSLDCPAEDPDSLTIDQARGVLPRSVFIN